MCIKNKLLNNLLIKLTQIYDIQDKHLQSIFTV
jgi:hypothetical protein